MESLPAQQPVRTARQVELLRHFDALMALIFLERSGTGRQPWASNAGSTLLLDEATENERKACPVHEKFEPANRDVEFLQLSGNPHCINAALEEVPAFRQLACSNDCSNIFGNQRQDGKHKKFRPTVTLKMISSSLSKPLESWTDADKSFLLDVARGRSHNSCPVACEFRPQVQGGGSKLQPGQWGHEAASAWLLRIDKAKPLNGFSTFPSGVTCTCKVGSQQCSPLTEALPCRFHPNTTDDSDEAALFADVHDCGQRTFGKANACGT